METIGMMTRLLKPHDNFGLAMQKAEFISISNQIDWLSKVFKKLNENGDLERYRNVSSINCILRCNAI